MLRIVVVQNGRNRQAMCFIGWETLCALKPGQVVPGTGGELRVHTGSHEDQYWNFCEELTPSPSTHRIVITQEYIDRLKSYVPIDRPDQKPEMEAIMEAHLESFGWKAEDLCPKCHEPVKEEAKFCADCGTPYQGDQLMRPAPPQSFADLVSYHVIGKPEKPEEEKT